MSRATLVDIRTGELKEIIDTSVTYDGGETVSVPLHLDMSPNSQLVYATCEFRFESGALDGLSPGDWGYEGSKHRYEIATANIDGSDVCRLTSNDNYDDYPVWSPDGTKIAFLSGPGHLEYLSPVHLATFDTSGRDFFAPGARGIAFDRPPAWSPDGGLIAFSGSGIGFFETEEYSVKSGLFVLDPNDRRFRWLTESVSQASWSPDGQELAFAAADGSNVALFTIDVDGANRSRVATIGNLSAFVDRWPGSNPYNSTLSTLSWSPNGRHILFSCEISICVADLEANSVLELAEVGFEPTAAWSPDGSRIAVMTEIEHLLYIMDPDGGRPCALLGTSGRDSGTVEFPICSNGLPEPVSEENSE